MVANPISADFALVNPIAAPEMAGSFLALDGAGAKVLNGHLTAQEKASLRGSSGRGGGSWRVAGGYEAEEDRGEEEEGTHDEPVARLVPASATGETASRCCRRTRRNGAAASASARQTAALNRHRTRDGDGAAATAAARAASETSSSRRRRRRTCDGLATAAAANAASKISSKISACRRLRTCDRGGTAAAAVPHSAAAP